MTISLPKGFQFAGVSCGIKASRSKDISLIYSPSPATAAGVYTQNQVVAAPVLNCRQKTPSEKIHAVVTNSGNANACTGSGGLRDAERMCQLAADVCGIESQQVLVMSTGIIGRYLPMEKLEQGIQQAGSELGESSEDFYASADAILTTDQSRKVVSRPFQLGGRSMTLVGMAKGAGMIGPNMATMLCTCLTDAALTAQQADRLLRRAADLSFNNISVEGHTSTNDTMLLLANGAAGGETLSESEEAQFAQELNTMCIELAKMIPTDGEGASHLIEVCVTGASNDAEAKQIAKAIASSNLVKTAVYGNDPNWGRIVSAAGYAGPQLDHDWLKLELNGIPLFEGGEPVAFDPQAASATLRENTLARIALTVGQGSGMCTHWSSDLTVEYVRFNSDYST